MHRNHAPGWWPTRILLAIGFASVVAIGLGLLAPIIPEGFSGDHRPPVILGPLLIPGDVLIWVVAFVPPVVGLIWMVRVFRGPRDEPPPWRHRDR